MCRPKERESPAKGGESSQRGDARGSDDHEGLSACQRQATRGVDAINVIVGKSAVIVFHAVCECRTGPQTGKRRAPRSPAEERVSDYFDG
jgi:hypothetical protein